MATLLPNLQNLTNLPKDEADISIIVGTSPNVETFYAHTSVLNNCPYFAKLYSSQDSGNNIILPEISPKIFKSIYNCLCTGNPDLRKLKTPEIVEVLITADKLGLKELVDQLQDILVEKKLQWMEKHFIYIQQISLSPSFCKLQNFCDDFIKKYPESIFRLPEFTEISEEMLVELLERDDLLLEEAVIWEHVLKWGFARVRDLPEDVKSWSDEDLDRFKDTLKKCLPLVRFSYLTSQQFYEKAHHYIFRIDPVFHDHLLKFYLVPNTEQLYHPRQIEINGSKIINDSQAFSQIFAHLSKVINNEMYRDLDYSSYSSYSSRSSYNPYELKLLLRGSRHGFTPKVFHELCDDKPNTVTIIKVKGKDEILGGYNPDKWVSKNGYGNCKSFIFTLKNNFEKLSISAVDYNERALNYGVNYGPSFGLSDLIISGQNFKYDGSCYCKMDDYKQHIRNTENIFSIEDYEVFQIIKKN